MSRGGKKKDRSNESERRCIVTGESAAKSALIRFCAGPDDVIVPDISEKLPGRGFWVSAEPQTLEKFATEPGLAARALKKPVKVPKNIVSQVEDILVARVISLLSMARKAGVAIAGFENAKKALRSEKAAAIIQAVDGSQRGKTKLSGNTGQVCRISCLTGSEIGLAFGRKNVIHSVLLTSGLTISIVGEAKRLAGLRKVGKGA